MPDLKQRPGDQPLPIPNDEPDIQSQVIADIEARTITDVAVIPLRNRDGEVIAEAIVDQGDYERVAALGAWHRTRNGYVQRTWKSNGKRYHVYLHRFLLGLTSDDPEQVDHRNRNRLDNRRSNLRVVSNAENAQNTVSKEGSSSRYIGVTWDASRGKWSASAYLDGKRHHIGRFDDEDEAGVAVMRWRAENMPYSAEASIEGMVIADVIERRELGRQRYGTALQPFNGRDALRDLYEELLDGAMYAKQVMVERERLAELRDNLLALRAQWNTRRAEREAHRETADGPTARLASIEHDIYARVLRELDAVLGTGEGR